MFSRLMSREARLFELFDAHADLSDKGGRQPVALVAGAVSAVSYGDAAVCRH